MKNIYILSLLALSSFSFAQEIVPKNGISQPMHVATPIETYNSYKDFFENGKTETYNAQEVVFGSKRRRKKITESFSKEQYIKNLEDSLAKNNALTFTSFEPLSFKGKSNSEIRKMVIADRKEAQNNPDVNITNPIVGLKYNEQSYLGLGNTGAYAKLNEQDKAYPYLDFTEENVVYYNALNLNQRKLGNKSYFLSLLFGLAEVPVVPTVGFVLFLEEHMIGIGSKTILNSYSYKDQEGKKHFIYLVDKNALLNLKTEKPSIFLTREEKNAIQLNSKKMLEQICKEKNIDFSKKDITYEQALELIQKLNQNP